MNKAKKYLYEIKYIDADIVLLKQKIKAAEMRLTSLHGVRYDVPKVQGGQGSDWLENGLDSLYAMKSKLTDLTIMRSERMIRAMQEIFRMPDESYREVLSRYFLDGWSIPQIARSMGTTERATYMAYSRALKQFAEVNAGVLREYESTEEGPEE